MKELIWQEGSEGQTIKAWNHLALPQNTDDQLTLMFSKRCGHRATLEPDYGRERERHNVSARGRMSTSQRPVVVTLGKHQKKNRTPGDSTTSLPVADLLYSLTFTTGNDAPAAE